MHDLGKVIMNNEMPEAYITTLSIASDKGVPSIEAEDEVYGYNHADLGAVVSEKWGFPPMLSSIIEMHHLDKCSLDDIDDPVTAQGIACINPANSYCRALGIGHEHPDDTIDLQNQPSAHYLNIDSKRIDK